MADIGVNAKAPDSNLQALRDKQAYLGWLGRMASIEVQREEARIAEQRLAEEEASLRKNIAEYEAKNRKGAA